MDDLQHALDAAQAVVEAGDDFPDERLKLLFVCAPPAIDPAACSATRTTLVGSTTPLATRSPKAEAWASKP